jgi:hypothetical protein
MSPEYIETFLAIKSSDFGENIYVSTILLLSINKIWSLL